MTDQTTSPTLAENISVTRNNTDDHASFAVGIEGYGAIKVEGTNAFVLWAVPRIAAVTDHLLEKYVEEELAKGRDARAVRTEFLDALEAAARKALAQPAAV